MTAHERRDGVAGLGTRFNEVLNLARYEVPSLQVIKLAPDSLERCGLGELADLPPDIGIMGGSARAIVQRQLYDEEVLIRDVDLMQVEELLVTGRDECDRLVERFMPEDAHYGYELHPEGLVTYFESRDFTINEVLVLPQVGAAVASPAALDHLENKVICPSDAEANYWRSGLGPKLTIKAELMEAVLWQRYGQAECRGFERGHYDQSTHPFFAALMLNKAFQYEPLVPGVTRRYLTNLGYHSDTNPIEVAAQLAAACEYDFSFRGSPLADQARRYIDSLDTDPCDITAQWQGDPFAQVARWALGGVANDRQITRELREYW